MNFLTSLTVNDFFEQTGENCLVIDKELKVVYCSESCKELISRIKGVKEVRFQDLTTIENLFEARSFKRNVLDALNGNKRSNLLRLKVRSTFYSVQYLPFNHDNKNTCFIILNQVEKENRFIDLEALDFLVGNQSGGVVSRHLHLPDGSIKYLYISEGIKNLSGVSQKEVLDDPDSLFAGIYDETELELLINTMGKSIKDLSMFSHEWKIRTPDNKVKWLKGTGMPTLRDDGVIVFDAIVLDITDIKERLEEQNRLRLALQRSKEQFESFTDNLPGVLGSLKFTEGQEPRLTYVSSGIEELNGITVEEALDDMSSLWTTVDAEDLMGLQEAVQKSVSEFIPYKHSWRIRTRGGEEKWLRAEGAPRLMEDGSISLDSIMFDITPLKQAEEKLNDANNSLKKALDEKNILLRELQHRVKNNLNLVSNYIYLKTLNFKHEDLKEFALELNNRIFTIAQSHEKMLGISDTDTYSIKEFLEDLADHILTAFIVDKSLYELEFDVENIKLDQDKSLMVGLITNEIVSNIIKYAYDANEKIKVSFSLKKTNGNCVFVIRDFGKGFDVANGRSKKGIGMNLIERLAEYLNGTHHLTIDSGVIHHVKFPV